MINLETRILDSRYNNCLQYAYEKGYISNNPDIKLTDLNMINESLFPKAYIPKRIEDGEKILYRTFDSIHDITNSYDIRYLWFSNNGELYQDSLLEYFTYDLKNPPTYMIRIEIDKHFSSVRTVSYCINTQSISIRTDKISDDERISIFETEILDPDVNDKISSIIDEIKFKNFKFT